jgi:conjugative transfer region protein (TIGR03750 family)
MKEPGMNGREIEFIPDRLIDEPVVFRGLTDTEVVVTALSGIVFWIPVSVIVLMPFGYALFGVGIGFGGGMLTLLIAGSHLQKLKRRMPDGLHVVHLKKKAQKLFSCVSFGYIETSQSWDIRRERSVVKNKAVSED